MSSERYHSSSVRTVRRSSSRTFDDSPRTSTHTLQRSTRTRSRKQLTSVCHVVNPERRVFSARRGRAQRAYRSRSRSPQRPPQHFQLRRPRTRTRRPRGPGRGRARVWVETAHSTVTPQPPLVLPAVSNPTAPMMPHPTAGLTYCSSAPLTVPVTGTVPPMTMPPSMYRVVPLAPPPLLQAHCQTCTCRAINYNFGNYQWD